MNRLLAYVSLLLAAAAHDVRAQPTHEGAQPPSHAELLEQLAGDSASRLKALRFAGKRLWDSPEEFYPAITQCMDDNDVRVRRSAVIYIGQYMIWNPGVDDEQNPKAIQWLVEQTHDEDYQVIYNCVYYGLSTVKHKDEALLNRLLDIVLMRKPNESLSLLQRVAWGCRPQAGQTASLIQARIDALAPDATADAETLTGLYFRLAKRYPKNLARFDSKGTYAALLTVTPPFFPRNADEVESRLRQRIDDDEAVVSIRSWYGNGEFGCLLRIDGIGNYVAAMNEIADGHEFAATDMIPPYSSDELGMDSVLDQIEGLPRAVPTVDYEAPFRELYQRLGRVYPNFAMKGIDWNAVGEELIPRSKQLRTQSHFCLLCQELLARLEDSHAYLGPGSANPVSMPSPQWDPGFACLLDDLDRPVIYHLVTDSAAAQAGLQVGMIVTHIDDRPAAELLAERMATKRRYVGYSSDRYLQYQTVRQLARQLKPGSLITINVLDRESEKRSFKVAANTRVRYVPRLPVPTEGISDSANVSWKALDDEIGYIYVRRMRPDLIERLDAAVGELAESRGLIIDVRGNSGGGFHAARSFRNFDLEDEREPHRPRFTGPMVMLIDARCISAGEGWASWFQANGRAKLFGQTTAGASGRKTTIDVMNGLYTATVPVKAYKGFLDRPIERRGLKPDVAVCQSAIDLANGIDTVLAAARQHLQRE